MDQVTALGEAVDDGPRVTVAGAREFVVTAATLEDLEIATESVDIVCATGNRYAAAWTGPTVGSLLVAAEAPPDTTHLLVESDDEYRVTIPASGALDGVLAYLKDGEPIGEAQDYANRLVCPATEGARDVKGVTRIEPVALEPNEDPESLENLFPEGHRYTAKHAESAADGETADPQKTSES